MQRCPELQGRAIWEYRGQYHRAGEYWQPRRLPSRAAPISKQNFEVVLPDGGKSYFVSRDEAKAMVKASDAKWTGPKSLQRISDKSKRAQWVPIGRSALYCEGMGFGPKFCTLQLV